MDEIKRFSPEQFSERIQGQSISRELVLGALVLENSAGIDPGPHYLQHVKWLKEKIQTADQEWLQKFVVGVTGRKVLQPGARLNIKPTWREEAIIEIHTCFNSLDLPRVAMTKEAFDLLLSQIDNGGYNVS